MNNMKKGHAGDQATYVGRKAPGSRCHGRRSGETSQAENSLQGSVEVQHKVPATPPPYAKVNKKRCRWVRGRVGRRSSRRRGAEEGKRMMTMMAWCLRDEQGPRHRASFTDTVGDQMGEGGRGAGSRPGVNAHGGGKSPIFKHWAHRHP